MSKLSLIKITLMSGQLTLQQYQELQRLGQLPKPYYCGACKKLYDDKEGNSKEHYNPDCMDKCDWNRLNSRGTWK